MRNVQTKPKIKRKPRRAGAATPKTLAPIGQYLRRDQRAKQ